MGKGHKQRRLSAMLEAIKEKLRAAGLTVYDFAEKIGTCKAPYMAGTPTRWHA